MNYIPIKLNLSGVYSPIFASALLMFPSTLLQRQATAPSWQSRTFENNGYAIRAYVWASDLFCHFYSSIVFNAKDISGNLSDGGALFQDCAPVREPRILE